jgi:hypothetical protein
MVRHTLRGRSKMATPITTAARMPGFHPYAQKARWATVRVETDGEVYEGKLYIPETKKRVSDLLCDDRMFLNMTDVTINGSTQTESFVALNKSFVKCVRVVEDKEGPEQR